jgi:GNAT superfamily N-acetyltransferase
MVLNPKLAHCQVADPSDATPPANADRGTGVGMNRQGKLHPEVRGQGLGAELLQKAEGIARKRGCIGLWLHTGTFQAPGFYEKQGYITFGTIPDYPLGHDTVYFMKRLA